MNFMQLSAFVKTCELKSFKNAAKALFVSQSAVSQSIKSLEQELDCVLFLRTTRSLTLTVEGEALYPYAKKLLSVRDEALNELSMISGASVQFTVGLASPNTDDYIQNALTDYYKLYPKAVVAIEHLEPDVIRNVRNWQKSAVYIVSKEWLHEENVYLENIAEFKRLCILRPDDPLSALPSLTMENLRGKSCYVFSNLLRNPKQMKERRLWELKDSVNFIGVNNVETAFSKIAVSGGVCMIPGYLSSYKQFGLVGIPMSDGQSTMLAAASIEPITKPMLALISSIRAKAQDI